MTPAEVEMWIEGVHHRKVEQEATLAHFASIILSPHTKKTPRPDRLMRPALKPPKPSERIEREGKDDKVVSLERARKLREALRKRKSQ